MATNERPARLDDGLQAIRIGLGNARRAEMTARGGLQDAQHRSQQWRDALQEAQRRETQAQQKHERAQRTQLETGRRLREARQNREPLHKWQAEARRYELEARRSAQELKRWGDEAARKDRELKFMTEDVKTRTVQLERRTNETQEWKRRLEKAAARQDGPRSEPDAAPDVPAGLLPVMERAAAALNAILDGMVQQPSQALRLMVGPDGDFSLALDVPREGDQIVTHLERDILLIGAPLPESLKNVVLDVSYTPTGTSLVLTPLAPQHPAQVPSQEPVRQAAPVQQAEPVRSGRTLRYARRGPSARAGR